MSNSNFRENNFDLIRLSAALQVAITHSAHHLKISDLSILEYVIRFLKMFPGVPIFFFVSGFLISRSYEKNSNILQYSRNRFLRLFPALIICGAISIVIISMSGYLAKHKIHGIDYLVWIFSQITFFQFYDPDFLHEYGIGCTNGSLWTIYIELQFYFVIPIIYVIRKKAFETERSYNQFLAVLCLLFIFMNRMLYLDVIHVSIIKNLLKMSLIPYFYMFIVGIIFQRHFTLFYRFFSGKFILSVFAYILFYSLLNHSFSITEGNGLQPVLYFMLCVVIFSFAFSYRQLSHRILKLNDISYGIYLYHMPIVNLFIYLNFDKDFKFFVLTLLICIIMAIFSFKAIEKPAIKLKSNPLKVYYESN